MKIIDADYATSNGAATPEYVLAVLQDWHRHALAIDSDVEPGETLTFETTVQEWRLIWDLVPWRKLAKAYNKFFEINCSLDQWRAVLEPAETRTLWDVCNLIAAETSRPQIRPAHLLGPPCHSAGAFLTVRSILQKDGANIAQLAPHTELSTYARYHWKPLLESLIRIAPGTLPTLKIRKPLYDAFLYGLGLSFLSFILCNLAHSSLGILLSLIIGICCFFGGYHAAKNPPKSVEIGDLKTFRDLSTLLADANNTDTEKRF